MLCVAISAKFFQVVQLARMKTAESNWLEEDTKGTGGKHLLKQKVGGWLALLGAFKGQKRPRVDLTWLPSSNNAFRSRRSVGHTTQHFGITEPGHGL
jgi:hypothetical protein